MSKGSLQDNSSKLLDKLTQFYNSTYYKPLRDNYCDSLDYDSKTTNFGLY